MKARFFIFVILLFCNICIHAQLKVDSTGVVSVGPDSLGNARLNIGNVTSYDPLNMGTVNLYSQVNNFKPSLYNIGVYGEAYKSTYTSSIRTIGVYGKAGGGENKYNMGVVGFLGGTGYGAAIVGTMSYNSNGVYGRYAGAFNGPVYVSGSLTATSYITGSDRNLKENIAPLTSDGDEPAIEKVMDMNVVKYNYKKREIEVDENVLSSMSEDELAALELERERAEQDAKQLHFGLIAQELQTIYPNLVIEGQDGNLAINYVELVPVLIQSIQELKQEINEMKGVEVMKANMTSDIAAVETSVSALYQNTPNPFNGNTTIRFRIADGARTAYICIFDMQGKQLQRHDVSTNDDSLTIDGKQLGAGMYLYSLIVDGKEIDTKRMILSK